jgi:NADH-ubiquinone oxidoreductase chain 5
MNRISTFVEWNLGGSENNLTATLLLDHTSFIFLRVVLFISSNVVFYRKSYIREDFNADRFILLVFGFVVSIVIIIISPNIISILLG